MRLNSEEFWMTLIRLRAYHADLAARGAPTFGCGRCSSRVAYDPRLTAESGACPMCGDGYTIRLLPDGMRMVDAGMLALPAPGA